jgi:hypothetical protein
MRHAALQRLYKKLVELDGFEPSTSFRAMVFESITYR